MDMRVNKSRKCNNCHERIIRSLRQKYNAYYSNEIYSGYNNRMAENSETPSYRSGLLQVMAYRILRTKLTETLEKYSLIVTEWAMLGILYESKSNGVHLADIAGTLHVEPPLITTMVAQLEKKELVDRRDDVRDRRAKFIYITQKGRELVPEVEKIMQETLSVLLRGISVEELKIYKKVLEAIVKNAS